MGASQLKKYDGLCFDSILVRLKAIIRLKILLSTIRFDSILVRLKVRLGSGSRSRIVQGFDSILVRLKGIIKSVKFTRLRKFRFHTGSIKSVTFPKSQEIFHFGFDSILVRLKVSALETEDVRFVYVSIPYWFD